MAGERRKRAVLIAGPTASGKSALALRRAREMDAVIINADAMQVYADLRVVTARPSAVDEAAAPHRLYGTVPGEVRFSTGAWVRGAEAVLGAAGDRPVIFVGGTGLYFEALVSGFADAPAVDAAVTAEVEAELAGLDREGRDRLLRARDPAMAERLQAADPQRVTRALAVLKATGRSLATFQDREQQPLLDGYEVERLVLNPDRDVLRRRIAERFAAMFRSGAVEEVQALLARGLLPSLPIMKAIGVREIGALLAGALSEAKAIERAVIATRQYAKRQRTWFRGRMADWQWVES